MDQELRIDLMLKCVVGDGGSVTVPVGVPGPVDQANCRREQTVPVA